MKRSVRCFAVKASRGLKPLFPLCLAESQNNQKLCVAVVVGFGEMAGIHVRPPPIPGFTLITRSAALFLPPPLPRLHPCFISR